MGNHQTVFNKFKCRQKYIRKKVVLVGLITQNQKEDKERISWGIGFLADTAGAKPEKCFSANWLLQPKNFCWAVLQEIKQYVDENEIGLVIFDDELSPKQLQKHWSGIKMHWFSTAPTWFSIFFAKRAQTANAKTQVELAQLQYMFPRSYAFMDSPWTPTGWYRHAWSGETQIETDRRIILRTKIALLNKTWKDIDKQMSTQKKNREKWFGCAGWLYKRWQINTYEFVKQIGNLAENKLCDPRHYRSESNHW